MIPNNANATYMIVLYCLGNNGSKKSVQVQYRCNFPPNIFSLWLMKPVEYKGLTMTGIIVGWSF